MSQWLDEHRLLLAWSQRSAPRRGQDTGRQGLPAEAVLRCALLKQYRQLSYEELAFHLEDSASFRAFARLPMVWSPSKSVLHKTISAITSGNLGSRSITRCFDCQANEAGERQRRAASTAQSLRRCCMSPATAPCFGMRPG